MRFGVSGATVGLNTTAATAWPIAIYNPAAVSTVASKIYEWSIGPQANSADNCYTIKANRTTTAGTWTSGPTPSPLDGHYGAALSLAGLSSTAAPTAGVELGRWGFHMRGGYRWVAIPGGELSPQAIFNYGIGLNTVFAQGSDVCGACIYFDE